MFKWSSGPNGELWAEIEEYRLIVRSGGRGEHGVLYTVLRRQYGKGSPFALVGSGHAATLTAAMRAAEHMVARLELS